MPGGCYCQSTPNPEGCQGTGVPGFRILAEANASPRQGFFLSVLSENVRLTALRNCPPRAWHHAVGRARP